MRTAQTSNDRRGLYKGVLAIGFLALAFAVLRATATPAGSYEVSIYAGTPALYWVGITVALAVSLLFAFGLAQGALRTLALLLGGGTVASIAGLPFLRDYYYYGTADALTHLGWARDMSTGVLSPAELFYPGIHASANVVGTMTGIGIERSILLVVATMVVVTLVFVPLTVRFIGIGDRAVVIAAFSTFLLFMVHNLGVYLHAHSFAQGTFFTALVLFLAFAYVTRRTRAAFGIMLAITSVAVLLIHPQVAANLIVVFGAISLVQFVHRRYDPDRPIAGHRTLYLHTLFLAGAFVAWITRFELWAFYNLGRIASSLEAYLVGNPPTAGGGFQSQATSLTAIGSGLPEIFLKLFLVATIFSVLAGSLMAAAALRTADESRPSANAVALYLGVGSLGILVLASAYFAGDIAEHYFRHLGFLLLIATIVGSLALHRRLDSLSTRRGVRFVTVAIVLVFALMLPLSLATAYPSPFMYKQSQHVTEGQVEGYQVVFDLHDPTVPLAGIRQGPWRYSHGIQGVNASARYETVVRNENLSNLGVAFAGEGTLAVTDADIERETEAYRGIRYTDSAFRSLEAQPGVNRVVSNGDLRLYHVGEDDG